MATKTIAGRIRDGKLNNSGVDTTKIHSTDAALICGDGFGGFPHRLTHRQFLRWQARLCVPATWMTVRGRQ